MKFVVIPSSDGTDAEYWVDFGPDVAVARRALQLSGLESVAVWTWKVGSDHSFATGVRLWRQDTEIDAGRPRARRATVMTTRWHTHVNAPR